MSELRFVGISAATTDEPGAVAVILSSTPGGQIRYTPLTEREALKVIERLSATLLLARSKD